MWPPEHSIQGSVAEPANWVTTGKRQVCRGTRAPDFRCLGMGPRGACLGLKGGHLQQRTASSVHTRASHTNVRWQGRAGTAGGWGLEDKVLKDGLVLLSRMSMQISSTNKCMHVKGDEKLISRTTRSICQASFYFNGSSLGFGDPQK